MKVMKGVLLVLLLVVLLIVGACQLLPERFAVNVPVAHMLFAALLGCLGGKFAVHVHNSSEKTDNT